MQSFTKDNYENAPAKHAVRAFLVKQFHLTKIVGLPGPNIQHYINWCKSNGIEQIETWEYEPSVAIKQLSEIGNQPVAYNMGDVINAVPDRDDVLYDLDYCKTIRHMKHHVAKFRKNFIMTFSRRIGDKETIDTFFDTIKEKITSIKSHISPVKHDVYETDKGSIYIYAPYRDTSAMCCIAKIK